MVGTIVSFIAGTLLAAGCLWIGMRLTGIKGTFLAMLAVAAISSAVGFIPVVGWLLGLIVMFVLICKWTDAPFWPHAVLMVVIADLVGLLVSMALMGPLGSV